MMPDTASVNCVTPDSAAPGEDAAWVVVELPVSADAALAFVGDAERLFRLNPHLEIQSWERAPAPDHGQRYRVRWISELSGVAQELELAIVPGEANGFSVEYSAGIKRFTRVQVERRGGGTGVLTLRDVYDTPQGADREERLREVDRSLVPWGAAIRRYLLGLQRWGRWPLYRWYMTGYWLRMKPRERRIARLLIWTTALEFLVFALVLAVFLADHGRA